MSSTTEQPARIGVAELHALIVGDEELAVLDVREVRILQQEGTLLAAVSLPFGRIERRLPALVPRRGTPVAVVDRDGAGNGIAVRAARTIARLGYTDVAVLDGGVDGWRAAGREVFLGNHAIGQSFGEFVEDADGTPSIDAATLKARIDEGDDVVVLDSRPLPEYADHAIPGALDCPGAELVARGLDAVASPDTLVVVNCAGRTRSILGAQSLIDAGLPNDVVALEGGTMSWILADLPLEHGARRQVGAPSQAGRARAAAAAAARAERWGVHTIDHDELGRFQAEARAGARTLYLLDVRSIEEHEVGHLPEARAVPSWEVAPWIFRHAATRRARYVLVDDASLIRARTAGAWLARMGWGEVFALDGDAVPHPRQTGLEPEPTVRVDDGAVRTIAVDELRDMSPAPTVLEVEHRDAYRSGHVPGAWFALRSWLPAALDRLPANAPLVLTSDDPLLATAAAAEIAADGHDEVLVLDGGTPAWRAAGLPLAHDDDRALGPPDDILISPWLEPDPERQRAGFREYLQWEVALVDQLRRDDTTPFLTVPDHTTPARSA